MPKSTEPLCADPNCGHPRYAHHVDLKTERYENCLCCRECAGYQSAVLNAAIANLKEELRGDA